MNKSGQLQTIGTSRRADVSRRALAKFRNANPRIDYYPVPDAVAAIESLRLRDPTRSTRELIDTLVVTGMDALSGNGGRGNG